jgi:hypothetical protein
VEFPPQDDIMGGDLSPALFPNTPVNPHTSYAQAAYALIADDPQAFALSDNMAQFMKQATDNAVVDDTRRILGAQYDDAVKLGLVQQNAADLDLGIPSQAAAAQAVNAHFVAKESQIDAPIMRLDMEESNATRKANRAYISNEWRGALDKLYGDRPSTGNPYHDATQNSIVSKMAIFDDITALATPGTLALKKAQVLRQVFPDAPWKSIWSPQEYLTAWQEWILDQPKEVVVAKTDELLSVIKQHSVGVLGHNQYDEKALLDAFLDPIVNPADADGLNENLNSRLDIAGLVLAGVPVGKLYKAAKGLFTPRLPPVSPAAAAARTPSGAAVLVNSLNAADPAARLAAFGTDPVQVIGEFTPKLVVGTPSSTPYLLDSFVDPIDQMLSKEAGAATARAFFGSRLLDAPIETIEGGWKSGVIVGRENGAMFRSADDAKAWAENSLRVPFSVVSNQKGTGFAVKMDYTHYWDLSDIRLVGEVQAGGWWRNTLLAFNRNLLGKAANLVPRIQQSGTAAAAESEKYIAALHEMVQPYRRLAANEQAGVMKVLTQFEGKKQLSRSELLAQGLSSKQADAAESIYRAAETSLSLHNARARGLMVSEGWLNGRLNSTGEELFVKPLTTIKDPKAHALNLASGAKEALSTVDLSKYQVYELLEPHNGLKFAIAQRGKGGAAVISDLPQMVLKAVPGYLPRTQRAPYYIYRVGADGVEETVALADTIAQAEAHRAVLQQSGGQYLVKPASELGGDATTMNELRRLSEQGLLRGPHRRAEVVTDILGNDRLIPPDERLDAMLNSAGLSKGMGAWTDAMSAYLKQSFPGLDASLALDYATARRLYQGTAVARNTGSTLAEFEQGWALYKHIRSMAGLDPGLLEHRLLMPAREKIASVFYKLSPWAESANPVTKAVGSTARVLANDMAGLSQKTSSMTKSLAFGAYLAANPLRQALVQPSNIVTYMGLKGGLEYATSGRYFADFAILSAAVTPRLKSNVAKMAAGLNEEAALAAAAKFGYGRKEAQQLLDDFAKSGSMALASNHAFTIGTLNEGRIAMKSGVVQTAGKVLNGLKSVGFDLGVNVETRSAWLFNRNRFKVEKGRFPATREELDEVTANASRLQLNMNRGDVHFLQKGVLSMLTQFYTYQFKMVGRMLGVEAGWTPAEKARMGFITLASYGVQGYGFNSLVSGIEAETGATLPEPVKYIILQGAIGSLINQAFAALDEPGEDKTRLNVSGSLSPTSFTGQTFEGAKKMLLGITGQTPYGFEDLPLNAAGLGFIGGMGDVVDFGFALMGHVPLPAEDKAYAFATEFLKRVPITNNIIKGMMMEKYGRMYDLRGKAIVDGVSTGEAWGTALFGFQPQDKVALETASVDYYGAYTEASASALDEALQGQAKESMEWIGPLLRNVDGGTINATRANELLREHAATFNMLLNESERMRYWGYLAQEVQKMDVLKSDKFVAGLVRDFKSGTGKLRFNEDTVEAIQAEPDFPRKQEVIDLYKSMIEFAPALAQKVNEDK